MIPGLSVALSARKDFLVAVSEIPVESTLIGIFP